MKGTILRSTGSWYEIQTEDKTEIYKGRLRGKFKIKDLKVTNPLAVGDFVKFELEKGVEETAFITEIFPRENYFIRQSVQRSAYGHLIAANLDQVIMIVTLKQPRTSLGFIDRFVVSAEAFRIPAVLVFNKKDLYSEEEKESLSNLFAVYEQLGYRCLATSAVDHTGIPELKSLLSGKRSLLSGHSGVGKSTLLNHLAPGLDLKTSEISDFANKGVHTTTYAEMFEPWPDAQIIDTPGIKELGLFDIGQEELSHYFPEMRNLLGQCKFNNCIHLNEPKCAVIEHVKSGDIAQSRYNSYISMLVNEDSHR
jgi:ribosome biogenesis GTPase